MKCVAARPAASGADLADKSQVFSPRSRGDPEEDAENDKMIPGFRSLVPLCARGAQRERIPERIAQRFGFEPAEIAEWNGFRGAASVSRRLRGEQCSPV
jgi:hypothetical protein